MNGIAGLSSIAAGFTVAIQSADLGKIVGKMNLHRINMGFAGNDGYHGWVLQICYRIEEKSRRSPCCHGWVGVKKLLLPSEIGRPDSIFKSAWIVLRLSIGVDTADGLASPDFLLDLYGVAEDEDVAAHYLDDLKVAQRRRNSPDVGEIGVTVLLARSNRRIGRLSKGCRMATMAAALSLDDGVPNWCSGSAQSLTDELILGALSEERSPVNRLWEKITRPCRRLDPSKLDARILGRGQFSRGRRSIS
ncbi:hypothetical protein ACLOJK_018576 [Asimina triloba]